MTERITFTKIAILSDGYLPRGRSSKDPLIQNTFGFDVACYVILCRMVDDDDFKTNALNRMDTQITQFLNTYIEKGAHKQTYLARNLVLMTLYETKTVDGIAVIDCKSTPLNNIEKFYLKLFPNATSTSKCNCSKKKNQKR